jgi:hypothetical protein
VPIGRGDAAYDRPARRRLRAAGPGATGGLRPHPVDSYLVLAHLRAALAVLPLDHPLTATVRAAVAEAKANWRDLDGQSATVALAIEVERHWPAPAVTHHSAPPRACTTRCGARRPQLPGPPWLTAWRPCSSAAARLRPGRGDAPFDQL